MEYLLTHCNSYKYTAIAARQIGIRTGLNPVIWVFACIHKEITKV